MTVNAGTPVYGTNNKEHYAAVVDVDVNAQNPNDPTALGGKAKAQAVVIVGSVSGDGALVPGTGGALPAGTNRSEAVGTTAANIMAQNLSRIGATIQNVGAVNNIGISEFGTAVIGAVGTTTLVPGATYTVRTSNAISAIAATSATNATAIEW